MSQETPEQAKPHGGFQSVSTSLTKEEHDLWFDFCAKIGRTSGELLRGFIQATLRSDGQAEAGDKAPVNITIQSFEGLDGTMAWRQGDHVQANQIFAESEIKRIAKFLDERGWVALAVKKGLAKITRGLYLDEKQAQELRRIYAAPDTAPDPLSRIRDNANRQNPALRT